MRFLRSVLLIKNQIPTEPSMPRQSILLFLKEEVGYWRKKEAEEILIKKASGFAAFLAAN